MSVLPHNPKLDIQLEYRSINIEDKKLKILEAVIDLSLSQAAVQTTSLALDIDLLQALSFCGFLPSEGIQQSEEKINGHYSSMLHHQLLLFHENYKSSVDTVIHLIYSEQH